jgi:hypothetical protein
VIYRRSLSDSASFSGDLLRIKCDFEEQSMLDFIMLAIGIGFFVLSVGYTIFCDRL